MKASYTTNEEHKGIEIAFDAKPGADVRDSLKAAGYRWHNVKKVWYARQTPERLQIAADICEGKTAPAQIAPAKTANKFGVQVGDIFSASWGYDQTNVDFFQVIALVGSASVRVREVYPERIAEKGISGMSADRTYKIDREILPAAARSVFIKDQTNGDLKRLKSYAADGISNPQFFLTSFTDAHYCKPGTVTEYESWYA